jgi:hypothetical protein
MLVAPALAADPVKPAPAAPAASTTTPAAPAGSKSDAAGKPANANKSDKPVKTDGTSSPDLKGSKTDKDVKPGAAPLAEIKTIKPDKDLKTAKVAAPNHHRHSHHWYMVHRGNHPSHDLTAGLAGPVKGAGMHKPHQQNVDAAKPSKTPSSKGGSSS